MPNGKPHAAPEPNQGATGDAPAEAATEGVLPRPGNGAAASAEASINQGAAGPGQQRSESFEGGGESPLSVDSEGGALTGHPEILVAGAFACGLVAAQLLRRFGQ